MEKEREDPGRETLLITIPNNPYSVLQIGMNADSRKIQAAYRNFFKENPRNAKIGKNAQNKLINTRERAKVDAFCVECPSPNIDLNNIKQSIKDDNEAITTLLRPRFIEFSDLYFPDNIRKRIPRPEKSTTLSYRSEFTLT